VLNALWKTNIKRTNESIILWKRRILPALWGVLYFVALNKVKDITIPANILQVLLKRKFKHYEKSGSIPDF